MGDSPFPVDGAQVTVYQAAELHLYDSFDNHTGPTEHGLIETAIPGSSYHTVGDGIFASVPAGATYLIQVVPDGDQIFDLRVRDVEGLTTQFIQHTLVYSSIGVGASGKASLAYDPDQPGSNPLLGLDFDGDGTPEDYTDPTGELGPEDSYDFVAPVTTIHLLGQKDAQGWYTGPVSVTLSAMDAQSGVALIEYSLDRGNTIQEYSAPFQVVAEQTPVLYAQATDAAGNMSDFAGHCF